jgi:hypothetical protein
MLGLFGKKSDHPMADLKSAQKLLEDVPKNDALKALQDITAWIASVQDDEQIRLDNRFEVLRLLDETARTHEIKVTREYYSASSLSTLQEQRLWATLNDYFANLGDAYHYVLAGCRDGEKGASALKALRPLIVARGINATMGRLKCAATHYVAVEQEIWEQLAEYYTEAESQKCLDEPIALYPGASAEYSVRHQLAGVLLWWASGTGSLKPLQIHLSERLTAHLCRSFVMGAEPGEDTLFAFDLAQTHPPVRYNRDITAHPNLRFIGQGGVKLQLEPLIEKLEKGLVPGDVNLGGTYDAETVCEVAKRLAANWLSAPAGRRSARRNINVNLHVVRGFSGLIDKAFEGDIIEIEVENDKIWVAEDISATGFRCNLDAAAGAWVRVGALIGFRPDNVQHWGAGIVRRLRRGERNNLDVGVEILTNRTVGVKLQESGATPGSESHGLWLGFAGSTEGESRVMFKPASFADNRTLQMQMADKHYMLIPMGTAAKGDDYDLTNYRMIEREASNGD